jgi:hypothetical protein
LKYKEKQEKSKQKRKSESKRNEESKRFPTTQRTEKERRLERVLILKSPLQRRRTRRHRQRHQRRDRNQHLVNVEMSSTGELLQTERVRVARALARADASDSAQQALEQQLRDAAAQLDSQRQELTRVQLELARAHAARRDDAAEARAVLTQWKSAFERELAARDADAERKLAAAKQLVEHESALKLELDSQLQLALAKLHSHSRTQLQPQLAPPNNDEHSPHADESALLLAEAEVVALQASLADATRQVAQLRVRLESRDAQLATAQTDTAAARADADQAAQHAAAVQDKLTRALGELELERARAASAERELARLRPAVVAEQRAARAAADEAKETLERWTAQAKLDAAAQQDAANKQLAAVQAQLRQALVDKAAAERRVGAGAAHQSEAAERLAALEEQFAAWRAAANEREEELKHRLALVNSSEAFAGAQAQIDSLQRLVRDERRRCETLAAELEHARDSAAPLAAQWRSKYEAALQDAADALQRERAHTADAVAAALAQHEQQRPPVVALPPPPPPPVQADASVQEMADRVDQLQLRINAYRDELEFAAQERNSAQQEAAQLREALGRASAAVQEARSATAERDAMAEQLRAAQNNVAQVERDAHSLLAQWRVKFERELLWAAERNSQQPQKLAELVARVQQELHDAVEARDRLAEQRKAAVRDADAWRNKHAAAAAQLSELESLRERVAELEERVAAADEQQREAVAAACERAEATIAELRASVERLEIDVEVRELRIGELVTERELALEQVRQEAAAPEHDADLMAQLDAERNARAADADEARRLLAQWRTKFEAALRQQQQVLVEKAAAQEEKKPAGVAEDEDEQEVAVEEEEEETARDESTKVVVFELEESLPARLFLSLRAALTPRKKQVEVEVEEENAAVVENDEHEGNSDERRVRGRGKARTFGSSRVETRSMSAKRSRR